MSSTVRKKLHPVASVTSKRQFAPKGTPFQQRQRLQNIERYLARESKRNRAEADKLDRLRAKIADVRAAERPIERTLLWGVVRAAGAIRAACLLGGGNGRETERQVLDLLYPPRISQAPVIAPQEKQRSDQHPADSSAAQDAVSEATAIVRNLDITEIDWSKEPASDYERRIRVEYLVEASFSRLLLLQLKVANPASDLRKALTFLRDETAKARKESERQRIQDIRAKIDREGYA